MFICSFKLNKTRLFSAAAALCLTLTLILLALPGGNQEMVGNFTAKNQQEMVDYLEKIGYTVAPQAVLIEQVTIPATFDETYKEYNKLQTDAGFDLSPYSGKSAHKYTFKILNYEDKEVEAVANLLIADGKIIGGDISSTELGGFCKGLVTKSDEKIKSEDAGEQPTQTVVDTETDE